MFTRSSIFYLARAWEELYFGDAEKANYYMDKFCNEGNQMDKDLDTWILEKRMMIKNMGNEKE